MQDDPGTSGSIKRAARRLLALNSVDSVSVREIIAAAGQKNASALNYHFGSKEGLVQTLVGDALAIADGRWARALDAAAAAGGPASVREVLEILVLGGLPPNAPEGDEASARFLAMLLQTRRDLVEAAVAGRQLSAYGRALGHIKRLMPPMPDSARDQRLLFYFWASTSVLAVLEGAAKSGAGYARPWAYPDPLRNFIDAMVGMLEAPWTSGQADATSSSGSP